MSESNKACCPQTGLPIGDHPPALPLPHFPTRWQAVLWRNWSSLTPQRLAHVLGTTPDRIIQAAEELGLHHPATPEMEARWLSRGYITIIRRNWHLLPYAQLLTLLDWSPQRMAFVLKEDDFLWVKLGRLKPQMPEVRHAPLTAPQQAATRAIAELVKREFPDHAQLPEAQPFDFLDALAHAPDHAPCPPTRKETPSPFDLRLTYSYSAVYGDPLLDPTLDPYPQGLLQRLTEQGINAIWLQAILYTLTPWLGEIVPAAHRQARMANLNALVEKARRFGIGVYLYLNEPRGMQAAAFERQPTWKGGHYPPTDVHAMCPASDAMLQSLEAGVHDLFSSAPGLAGALMISMSENVTHCRSKAGISSCMRCRKDELEAMVARVNNTMARGIHRANPAARVIVWSWGWRDDLGRPGWPLRCIDQLDPNVAFMCTSEANLPTSTLGCPGVVGDYSISKVGPGPHAMGQWRHAQARGLSTLAKVQLNNTWECSAVPYLPVPLLIHEHLQKLEEAGVQGLMVAWTLGGYPGGNLSLLHTSPQQLAHDTFGPLAAPRILQAWQQFSQAFTWFPIHGVSALYLGPQNVGPMNLLHETPTGRTATMLGFPYDDLDAWRGQAFSRKTFEKAFAKLTTGWSKGLCTLAVAKALVPTPQQPVYEELARIAQAAYCHFRSTCLQIRFIRLRDENARSPRFVAMRRIVKEEIQLTKTLYNLARHDSRLGYEASNHYYYTPHCLMEKVIDCHRLLDGMPGEDHAHQGLNRPVI